MGAPRDPRGYHVALSGLCTNRDAGWLVQFPFHRVEQSDVCAGSLLSASPKHVYRPCATIPTHRILGYPLLQRRHHASSPFKHSNKTATSHPPPTMVELWMQSIEGNPFPQRKKDYVERFIARHDKEWPGILK